MISFAEFGEYYGAAKPPFTEILTGCHGVLISCTPSASLDSLHLRAVPSIAMEAQGYMALYSLRRGNYRTAHLPPVNAKPLTRWLHSWPVSGKAARKILGYQL